VEPRRGSTRVQKRAQKSRGYPHRHRCDSGSQGHLSILQRSGICLGETVARDTIRGRIAPTFCCSPLLAAPTGVEVTLRETSQRRLLFVLNHTPDTVHIPLATGEHYWEHLTERDVADALTLPGYDVALLEVRMNI